MVATVLFRNYGYGQHNISRSLSGGDIKIPSPLCPISHYEITNAYKNNHSSSIITSGDIHASLNLEFCWLLELFFSFRLHTRLITANIVKMKPTQHTSYIGNSNMTSFFRFANKQAIYRLGIISLAHAPVHVTDFPVVNVHVDEFGSKNCMPHCPQT